MSDWCILRTSGRNTLGLADSLRGDGFSAWTPIERIRKRAKSGERIWHPAPMLPSYVFADAAWLADLLDLSARFNKPHSSFSVMHVNQGIPIVSEENLNPLRLMERRADQRERPRLFEVGSMVRVSEGLAAGMVGMVKRSGPKHTLVLFHGMPFTLETVLLQPDERRAA